MNKTPRTPLQTGLFRFTILCFTLTAAMLTLTYPGVCQAHAPSDLVLTYDQPSQNLQVKIAHKTPWTSHYLKKVIVKKNGTVVETYEYTGQPDQNEFAYTYKVEAAPGDAIEVTASCNIFGSKTATLTIPK
jgi:hypothetical protein